MSIAGVRMRDVREVRRERRWWARSNPKNQKGAKIRAKAAKVLAKGPKRALREKCCARNQKAISARAKSADARTSDARPEMRANMGILSQVGCEYRVLSCEK